MGRLTHRDAQQGDREAGDGSGPQVELTLSLAAVDAEHRGHVASTADHAKTMRHPTA
jgi:hypothetical protein